MIRVVTRDGELPDGVVDGYCPKCCGDILVSAPDYACPECGTPAHPDSLPRADRLAVLEAQTRGHTAAQMADVTPEPIGPVKAAVRPAEAQIRTVTITATREALAWDRATDAVVAAAEQREATAKQRYDAAKAEYDAARQDAHRLRQLRALVRVDGAAALPAPAAKQKRGGSRLGGRWSRKHDACVNCGTTERKHASQGRCQACQTYWSRYGTERPTEEVSNDGN